MKRHLKHNGKPLCGTTGRRSDPTFHRSFISLTGKRDEVTCARCIKIFGASYLSTCLSERWAD